MDTDQRRLVLVVDTEQRFVDEARTALEGQRLLSVHSLDEASEVVLGGRVDLVLLGPAFASDVAITQARSLLDADPTVHLALVADVVTNRLLKSALRGGFADVIDTPLEARDISELLSQLPSGTEIELTVQPAEPTREPVAQTPEPSAVSAPSQVTFVSEPAAPRPAEVPAGFVVPTVVPAPQPAAPVPVPAPAPPVVAYEVAPPEPVATAIAPTAPPVAKQAVPAETPMSQVPPTPPPAEPSVPAAAPSIEVAPPAPLPTAPPEIPAPAQAAAAATPPATVESPNPVVPPVPEDLKPFAPPSSTEVLDQVLPPPPSSPPPSSSVAAPEQVAAVERPFVPRVPQPGDGTVIAVMAGKGGSGKTVVATNLAIAMGLRGDPERVAIVDADLQFGDVALLLQIDPVRTLDDLAGQLDSMSDERLDAALLRHESGVRVLPAPVLPVNAGEISAKQIVEIIDRMRGMYDVVVVDTGPVFDDGLVTILDYADEVITVVDMDLPSVKNAKVALDRLRQVGFAVDDIRLVVNRVNSKARLDLVELERSLGLRVGGSVPSDRLVPQSVNEGIPVLALSPRSKVARAFHALAESLDDDAARDRLNGR